MDEKTPLKIDDGKGNVTVISREDVISNIRKSQTTQEKTVKKSYKESRVIRKKSPMKRFTESFLGEGVTNVADYIMKDILVPATKNVMSDSVGYFFDSILDGFESLLFGEPRSRHLRREISRAGQSFIRYDKVSYKEPDRREIRRNRNSRHDFDELTIFKTRNAAIDVRDLLVERLEEYGFVTVAHLYNLLEITPNYTDEKYGWDDLSNSKVRPVRDGYLLVLPKPILID